MDTRRLATGMAMIAALAGAYCLGASRPVGVAAAQTTMAEDAYTAGTPKGYAVFNFPTTSNTHLNAMQASLNGSPITGGYRMVAAVPGANGNVVVIFATPMAVK